MNRVLCLIFLGLVLQACLLSVEDGEGSALKGIHSFTVYDWGLLKNKEEVREKIVSHLKKMGKVLYFQQEEERNVEMLVNRVFASSLLEISMDAFQQEDSKILEGSIKVVDKAIVERNHQPIVTTIWHEDECLSISDDEKEVAKRAIECVDRLLNKFSGEYSKANVGNDHVPTFVLFPGWK